jgi:Mn2+/Fe2+ NRAMP family transporter
LKTILGVTLGIITAIGGFVDVGAVATSGEAGAKFGLGLVWAFLLATVAIMLLVEMSGRLAAVSKKPYAAAIREHFGFKFYLLPLTSELIANALMFTAEIGGVAIALSLLTGLSWHLMFPVAAIAVFVMIWLASFEVIENGPAILGMVTLSFVVAIVALGGPPKDVVVTLWNPEVKSGELGEYLFLVAAILGAVISPYLIFFYSSGAREEGWTRRSLALNKITAVVGMGFGSITAIALVILSAMVLGPLHLSGGTLGEVGLAMGKALGRTGSVLFALALLVTCFGACLEVALSMAYNLSQGMGWRWGEHHKPVEAARFNLTIIVFLLVAVTIGLIGIDPLQLALLGSAVTALLLPISLAPFLVIMNDSRYLGKDTNGRLSNIGTIAIIGLAFVVAAVSMPLLLISGGG